MVVFKEQDLGSRLLGGSGPMTPKSYAYEVYHSHCTTWMSQVKPLSAKCFSVSYTDSFLGPLKGLITWQPLPHHTHQVTQGNKKNVQ